MSVKIEFDTGNAAFEGPGDVWEIERVLNHLAYDFGNFKIGGSVEKPIRDSNGNTIGTLTYVKESSK
jgi:hypothetical protein